MQDLKSNHGTDDYSEGITTMMQEDKMMSSNLASVKHPWSFLFTKGIKMQTLGMIYVSVDSSGRNGGAGRGNQRGVEVVRGRCDRNGTLGRKHIDHQSSLTENTFPELHLRHLESFRQCESTPVCPGHFQFMSACIWMASYFGPSSSHTSATPVLQKPPSATRWSTLQAVYINRVLPACVPPTLCFWQLWTSLLTLHIDTFRALSTFQAAFCEFSPSNFTIAKG